MAEIRGRAYPKGLTLCPEAPAGWAEVVYAVPPDRANATFRAEIGVTDSSLGNGSVTFSVRRAVAEAGPWERIYASPSIRGTGSPVEIEVPLQGAAFLLLRTTDDGDGINSDHAFWGDARLR